MAYTRQARASALRIVAAQGYHIAAALTGISETSLRRWAAEAAEHDLARWRQAYGPQFTAQGRQVP